MMATAKANLTERLEKFLQQQELRQTEPDPFRILNVTRTEAPYTHFLGWLLDPAAAHPWAQEFLVELLGRFGQPLPPPGPIEFCVESYCFGKSPGDAVGFTHPDILAVAPDRHSPQWALVIENKFDSKEGRALNKATKCAVYAARARAEFGEIPIAQLFTTKTGVAPEGQCGFAPVSYGQLAETVAQVREKLVSAGAWATEQSKTADRYACYFVEVFLRHIDLLFPDDDVRAAVRRLARGERPVGVSPAWLAKRPDIQAVAARQEKSLDRWDLETMHAQLEAAGALPLELSAVDAIFEWGQQAGDCDFKASGQASFVILIPTSGEPVQILAVQGRKLRFYWGHFIGGYDETTRPNRNSKKFPHAYELAERYCRLLNAEFGWGLEVLKVDGGFCEPSRPLSDVAAPEQLSRFLKILAQIAAEALAPSPGIDVGGKTI